MEKPTVRYIQSERLMDSRLDDEHIRSWRNKGFALVHDLLPHSLLAALKQDALAFYPEPNTTASEGYNDFSSGQSFVFPSRSTAFNAISLHPALLQAVADLLDVSVLELRLTQSDLWPKYGSDSAPNAGDNTDQRMHCDYPNHSLVHPPEWDSPEAVEMIVYLNDDFEGAKLMFALGDQLVVPVRAAGDATVHDCTIVHAVSRLATGVRYNLYAVVERDVAAAA